MPAGQVALQLRFAADSWVEIYDGSGKAVLYDLGKAGTERVATGTAPLSVPTRSRSPVMRRAPAACAASTASRTASAMIETSCMCAPLACCWCGRKSILPDHFINL